MTELEFHFHAGVAFSSPVHGHTFALHCLPMEDDGQKLQSYAVRIEPAAEYGLHRDGFGGWLVCGSCREAHMTFCYDSHGIVRVQGHSQAEPVNPVLKQFTELTAMTEELEALWRSLPLKGKSPQKQAELLNKAAADSLHYVPGVTGLTTTAGQALALGSGVCQDYAHILRRATAWALSPARAPPMRGWRSRCRTAGMATTPPLPVKRAKTMCGSRWAEMPPTAARSGAFFAAWQSRPCKRRCG